MALGWLMAALTGCSPAKRHGTWTSIDLHNTASVLARSYHFTLRAEETGVTLTGFCYDGGTEYRAEQPVPLSDGAAELVRSMAPEQAPTAKSSLSADRLLDGERLTVTVTHADGAERRVTLPEDALQSLIRRLKEELRTAAQTDGRNEDAPLS